MEIFVRDKFRVTTDESNYVLEEKTINKTGKNIGKERWTNIGYYHNLAHLFEDLLDSMPMDSDARSVDDLVKAVYESRDSIVAAIKQIKK